MMGESSELFVNCLEAMVECLPVDETAPPRAHHLSSSLSSISSPTEKGSL